MPSRQRWRWPYMMLSACPGTLFSPSRPRAFPNDGRECERALESKVDRYFVLCEQRSSRYLHLLRLRSTDTAGMTTLLLGGHESGNEASQSPRTKKRRSVRTRGTDAPRMRTTAPDVIAVRCRLGGFHVLSWEGLRGRSAKKQKKQCSEYIKSISRISHKEA